MVVYVSAPVYDVYRCSHVDCTSMCSLQVCRQPVCLYNLFCSVAYIIKSTTTNSSNEVPTKTAAETPRAALILVGCSGFHCSF